MVRRSMLLVALALAVPPRVVVLAAAPQSEATRQPAPPAYAVSVGSNVWLGRRPTEKTVQAAVDRVVKEGHRVLALVRHDESVVLLVGAAPPGHPLTTYRVVMARQNRLDAALDRAGDEGFGIGDVTPSEWKDDALVLLERGPVAAPRRFRTTAAFRGVSRTQDQLPSNELDQWFAEGFRPVAIVAGRIVLQGEVRGQAQDRPAAGSHLVIRGHADPVRAQVEEAATRAYEPVAFGARKDEVVVVMARSASGATRGATLVTTSDGLSAMQTTINAAAADGWQLWHNRVLVRDQWTLAAMVHSAEPPASYGRYSAWRVSGACAILLSRPRWPDSTSSASEEPRTLHPARKPVSVPGWNDWSRVCEQAVAPLSRRRRS